MKYKRLTQEQRYQIYALLKMAYKQIDIARMNGAHRITVNRKLRRKKRKQGYRTSKAQALAVNRKKQTKEFD